MPNNLTSLDLLDLAIQIEKNGRDYYDQAAKFVKAQKVKQVFEYISNDEQLHIAVFEEIISKLEESSEPDPKNPSEYVNYILALVEENVFTKSKQGSEMYRTIRNDKHALELALGFEKDSILFNYEIKKMINSSFHEEIDKLIAQEQDHFKRISDVLKGFNKFGVSGMP